MERNILITLLNTEKIGVGICAPVANAPPSTLPFTLYLKNALGRNKFFGTKFVTNSMVCYFDNRLADKPARHLARRSFLFA